MQKIKTKEYGFRSDYSTTLHLTELIDEISLNLNHKVQITAVLLDVGKTFNFVWHDGLIFKLLKLYIPVELVKIIKSNRKFKIKVENHHSSNRKVKAGIPQRSCLAPTLCNVFTKDMPVIEKSKVFPFTDDTMFFSTNKSTNIARVQHREDDHGWIYTHVFIEAPPLISPTRSVG